MLINYIPKAIRSSKISLVETLLFFLLYAFVGYTVDPGDILLIKTDLILLSGFLAIITLFFGLVNGLLALGMVGLAMYSFYHSFDVDTFLKVLVLVLVFGEFQAFWKSQIEKYQSQAELLQEQLGGLGKAFYALKVSHDQLELNYVLKPVSLRRSLATVLESFKEDEDYYHSLLVLLEKSFGVNQMVIASVEDGHLKVEAKTADAKSIESKDPMIIKAFETKRPVYIADDPKALSQYIAVMPSIYNNKVESLVLIEDMPFMSFQKDNLISITFIYDYFFETLHKQRTLMSNNTLSLFDNDFRFEFIRLGHLSKKYDIDSSILAFKTESELNSHLLNDTITYTYRDLDIHSTICHNGVYLTLILIPFSSAESARGLQERICLSIGKDECAGLSYTLFNLRQEKIIHEFLGLSDA